MDFNILKGKRVLITGHTGFKGSWLCLLLHYLGADVYGYALEPPTKSSLFEVASVDKIMHSHLGDIRDYHALSEVLKKVSPELIIHMAAQPLVRESYSDPVYTYDVNVMGTVHLLEAVRHINSVRVIINVTSDKCYENKEWLWGYRETDRLGGYDPYSNSKACSELVTASFRNSFFNRRNYLITHRVALASARAGNVIGGGDWATDRLIPDFIQAIIKEEKVRIRNPHAIRPWQHVLEPLTGYLALCSKLYTDGSVFAEAWNFGPKDADAKNVQWMVNTLCTLWGGDAGYEIDDTGHPHEAGYLRLDSSKSNALLNWHPKWNITETLDAVVSWTKAYLNGENMQLKSLEQISQYLQTN